MLVLVVVSWFISCYSWFASMNEKDMDFAMDGKSVLEAGKTALGIEFGSTRIKAVMTDYDGTVLAVGFHDWENSLADGLWTYSLDEIHAGLRHCFSSLKAQV